MIIGIIVGVGSALIVASVLGVYIYKKVTHKPTGDCGCCQKDAQKKVNRLLDDYHKEYGKKECSCCSHEKKI